MIEYRTGDLFQLLPYDSREAKIVPHVCNDAGIPWGSGFVVPLKKKWPHVAETYDLWCSGGSPEARVCHPVPPYRLGEMLMVQGERPHFNSEEEARQLGHPSCGPTWVANMVAQHETIRTNSKPIRYAALVKCMESVVAEANNIALHSAANVEIHAPKFGSDLAGGTWDFIEELIEEIWVKSGLSCTVYVLEN